MTHIFISYAKKDTRDLALALANALNQVEGLTVWVDKSLRAGRAWELQIQAEIDRCDAMVVLYSPDINRHKNGQPESYVLTEIAYTKYTANKPIIPVMAQWTEPPISLTMIHYIDFTLPGLTLDDLVAALCAELGVDVSSPVIVESETPAPLQAPAVITSNRPTSLDLMPKAFDWIEIPKKGYSIAKYPVTNAQFAKFVEAGGYTNKDWWTEAGWQAREEGWHYDDGWKPSGKPWTEPRYWRDTKWNGAEQPVVGVSWYEAVAFCLWLSDVTGENIMLPTEDQWQYAAQSDDGRTYPWGDDWDCQRCNNSVKPCNSRVTTPVTHYEGKGDSPFGVVDMAGNVWEWCLTDFENGSSDFNSNANIRALRGGSWVNDDTALFRCDVRNGFYLFIRDYYGGFRISRS